MTAAAHPGRWAVDPGDRGARPTDGGRPLRADLEDVIAAEVRNILNHHGERTGATGAALAGRRDGLDPGEGT